MYNLLLPPMTHAESAIAKNGFNALLGRVSIYRHPSYNAKTTGTRAKNIATREGVGDFISTQSFNA